MANPQPLDNVVHKDLRIKTDPANDTGAGLNLVPVVPAEFGDLQREYPIFFRRDPQSGEFQAVALLGLDKDENLFWDQGWITRHVPALLARGPFMLGLPHNTNPGETAEPLLYVDMDDPRVNTREGQPVFLPQGGHTPYLERVHKILKAIRQGMAMTKPFFQTLNGLELIEPIKVQIELNDRQGYTIPQFHGINRDKLDALGPEEIHRLHKSGFLEAIYLVLSSQTNVYRLVELKQRRLAAGER